MCDNYDVDGDYDFSIPESSSSCSSNVGGDPFITNSNGESTQFWLEAEKSTPLLSVGPYEIEGTVFAKEDDETQQWFKAFTIRTSDGKIPLRVEWNTTSTHLSKEKADEEMVALVYVDDVLETRPRKLFADNHHAIVGLEKLKDEKKLVRGAFSDLITFQVKDLITMKLYTTIANKLSSLEDGSADKYSHLDFEITYLSPTAAQSGLFAELLKGKDLSNATKAAITPPVKKATA